MSLPQAKAIEDGNYSNEAVLYDTDHGPAGDASRGYGSGNTKDGTTDGAT